VKGFDSQGFAGEWFPLVIGDRLPLERALKIAGSKAVVKPVDIDFLRSFRSGGNPPGHGEIPFLAATAGGESLAAGLTHADIGFGRPSPAACAATVSWIRTAVELTRSGLADAVCTCPINKEQLHRQGFAFPGHTEFIRDLAGAEEAVMMFCGPKLKVALATIHEPITAVPELLTRDLLRKVIKITAESLRRDFALELPRIGVAGLNPHAGEAGRFGRNEIEVIKPVIEEFEAARLEGEIAGKSGLSARISGPWPADSLFPRHVSGEFDAVVAMYHDQGLIPVKLVHFNEAVNVSLGLPIVRTSVDHGTAYDIAGTGTAHAGSLIQAVRLAASIARNRKGRKSNQEL
jgi:4-hydroxythreonine-4-phosphate dehydrogenase